MDIVPRIMRVRGEPSYMAVTPKGLHPGIGVLGNTEEEARENYADSLAKWIDLYHQAEAAGQ
jgi:hypothetical protein